MPHTVFEQENFYYLCDAESTVGQQELDDYEAEAGFVLRFADIDEAIRTNAEYKSGDHFDEIMIKRERMVMEIIKSDIL